ncbi:MAG TPA: hypothetical protein VK938_10560 [Methylophilaceae bacterium]|nr:hypothetical protein [Methylophilaceae bacterium]
MPSNFSMTSLKLDKELTRQIIVQVAPQYIELLRELQSNNKWVRLPDKFEDIFKRWRLDSYVIVFDDEKHISNCLGLFLMGQEGYKKFNDEIAALPIEEQQHFASEWLRDLLDESTWSWMEGLFPNTPEKEMIAKERFEALSPDDKTEALKRGAWFWHLFFGWFYQYLSVMLHGEKLTSLVAKAKSGDLDAFVKAVHIEPRLLDSHPFFKARFESARNKEAVDKSERNFLMRIGTSLAKRGGPGRISYPGLYVTFTILEIAGWLDGGFTHEEILDLCDEAGLDRWQNRIEDVNYLTKRLSEYRKRIKRS